MKKIGFIDYFLDEWHANNYPDFIDKASNGRYKVCYAYGKTDSSTGLSNAAWAEKFNVELLGSIDELIEKSDCIIVLSPNNPEMHEELSDKVLKSGKLTYIDKTFAPDRETAMRIFDNADKHNTKCYSSSALRFSTEWNDIDKSAIERLYSEGPNRFSTYAIHQVEPIVMLMQCRAKRVMFLGTEKHPEMIIEFCDGRCAHMYHRDDPEYCFKMTVINSENVSKTYQVKSDFFALFIDDLIKFFDTGIVPVPHEQTVDVMGILEAANKALKTPFKWIEI